MSYQFSFLKAVIFSGASFRNQQLLDKMIRIGDMRKKEAICIRYLLLWIGFILLFNGATLGLELLEGNKITTSEYYGLRNIGLTFLFLGFFLSLAYSVAPLLLSFLLNKIGAYAWMRILIYGGLGTFVGSRMFRMMYNDDLVEGYNLHRSTALMLFGTLGIVYGLLDSGAVKLGSRLRRG